MRNAKLWSLLLAALLLCACVVGILTTGVSASASRIPKATVVYEGSLYGESIRENLEYAATQTWKADDVLEIQFTGTDSSLYAKPNAANGVSGYTAFEARTIFREDGTKLPIIIRGMDDDKAATISGGANAYNFTNDYYFTNLTFAGGKKDASISFYAGCGEIVFENTHHNNTLYTYYWGDNQAMDTFIGWDAEKLAANVNEKGLLVTGITFGNGVTGLNPTLESPYNDMHFAAVGFNGNADCNELIYSLRRNKANVTAILTDEEVEEVRAAAQTATFQPSNIIKENCIVKPWDLSSYMIADFGTEATVDSKTADMAYSGTRRGVSPVREATFTLQSGGVQYMAAGAHNGTWNEVYAGDTKLVVRGGRAGGYGDVGIRLSNYAMFVGNVTLEIHEDDASVPTYCPWIQTVANAPAEKTSMIFGDYYFLMTGGTLGKAVTSGANGYYGAPPTTGKVVNEVRGGRLYSFNASRFGDHAEATPISTTLPGTGETLTATVAIHNKISGGIFGGLDANGNILASNSGYFAVKEKSADPAVGERVPLSICNEITGGTFYRFEMRCANNIGDNFANTTIYNFISGTSENAPVFKQDFHGAFASRTTKKVVNVIKGCPVFRSDDGTLRNIFGGTMSGTVNTIENYIGGAPVFDDFYGGCSGKAPTTDSSGKVTSQNNAIAGTITNHLAFDNTSAKMTSWIWGGNGYYEFKNVDGATADKGNEKNQVTGSLITNVYSGTYGTFRGESTIGTDACNITVNVYGGTWKDAYVPANRYFGKTTTAIEKYTLTNNIYGGSFEGNMYMGGQNPRDQKVVNNIYGGTLGKSTDYGYFGGGCGWTLSVENNIYGGTFGGVFYGGGNNATNGDFDTTSITNNIYGGKLSSWHDFMGARNTAAGASFDIVNNIYGGDTGSNWTYGGNRAGSCGTITNNFYSGKLNPCRDPENDLYVYYDEATMKEGGIRLRDQVVGGSGYDEASYLTNTCEGITNNLMGGCWTKEGGASQGMTFRAGMRWGIVNGDIVNNVIEGKYYRFFGGSDYGVINGNITNNFGKELAAGEQAPELGFYNYVSGTSTNIGYIYGGGMDNVSFPAKISAALAKAEGSRTATEKMYASIAATLKEGETYNCTTGNIVNNFYYGEFKQFYGGAYGVTTAGATSNIQSITNNVYGGHFDDTVVGSSTEHAYFGGSNRNANIVSGITNNIYGGVFDTNWYGGIPGSGTTTCPTITNNIYGGEGCASANKSFFMGNGSATFKGVIRSTFYGETEYGTGFEANKTYVFGGAAGTHTNTTADYAVENVIYGGHFCGFWGIGGGSSTKLNGNVKTTVYGGTFSPFDYVTDSMLNSIAGATRNGTTNGNVVLEIYGGVFEAHVIGGVLYGADGSAADELTGNVTLKIHGGEYRMDIYGVTRPDRNVVLAEGKTCTISLEQKDGYALKLLGEVEFDSVTANGAEIAIGADTKITAKTQSGKLAVNQTEGWKAHDYLILPAGAEYAVTESAGIYGSYSADNTILVKGGAVAVEGATLRLSDRVGVRVLLNKADVDKIGAAFTYKVVMDGKTVVSGTFADLVTYEGYYSFIVEGIGLNKFAEKASISGEFFAEEISTSVVDLAVLAQTAWAENATWKAYADAIVELNAVYNTGAENTLTPAAVSTQCKAEKGAADDIASASAALLMSDAAGMRLEVTLNNAPVNAKVLVNGKEVASTADGAKITAEFFFAHEYLAETFIVSVESDAGVHMTYTASIEAMASRLASDANNQYKNNATAFLCYVQAAVACK